MGLSSTHRSTDICVQVVTADELAFDLNRFLFEAGILDLVVVKV